MKQVQTSSNKQEQTQQLNKQGVDKTPKQDSPTDDKLTTADLKGNR